MSEMQINAERALHQQNEGPQAQKVGITRYLLACDPDPYLGVKHQMFQEVKRTSF